MRNFLCSLLFRRGVQTGTPPPEAPKQYDVFVLAKDINPAILKGMNGVILEVWDDGMFEVEFLDKDGINFQFEDCATFTVDHTFVGKVIWRR